MERLTIKDVSSYLNLKVKTLYKMIERGLIPHYRFVLGRGVIRFKKEEIDKWVSAKAFNAGINEIDKKEQVKKAVEKFVHGVIIEHGEITATPRKGGVA